MNNNAKPILKSPREKIKSHQSWSWIIIVSFFILSVYNVYWGLLGIVCMTMPIYHALRGQGKIHCSAYCPRGSFLGRFLEKLSMQKKLPKFMKSKKFKNALLMLMITMLTLSIIHSGGQIDKIAFALFRFMLASFVVGVIMGVFFKPRSWCQVCPMGHATGLITDIKKTQTKKNTLEQNKSDKIA